MSTKRKSVRCKIARLPRVKHRGAKLLAYVVNHILKNPKSWDQQYFQCKHACGTSHCVGGFSAVFAYGQPPDKGDQELWLMRRGDKALALGGEGGSWLFTATRSLREIYAFAMVYLATGVVPQPGVNPGGYLVLSIADKLPEEKALEPLKV